LNSHPQKTRYRIFDVCIDSELPLPGLSSCDGVSPDWTIICPQGTLDDSGYQWFHSWKSDDGQELMSTARLGDDYLLRIFDLAVFRILFAEHRIEVYALEECPPSTMAHLLLDQVLPRAICHEGRPVIHASAVQLDDGRVIAFTGPSGRGKSTLATAFHRAGHRVLADDCLLLELRGEKVCAYSAYPSLRLWSDSYSALAEDSGIEQGQLSEMAHYTSKKQLLFIADGQNTEAETVVLSALLLLEEPLENSQQEIVKIWPATGHAAMMALIEASFVLDVVSHEAVSRNFEMVGAVAQYVPVARIAYQRDFNKLNYLLDMITRFRFGLT